MQVTASEVLERGASQNFHPSAAAGILSGEVHSVWSFIYRTSVQGRPVGTGVPGRLVGRCAGAKCGGAKGGLGENPEVKSTLYRIMHMSLRAKNIEPAASKGKL